MRQSNSLEFSPMDDNIAIDAGLHEDTLMMNTPTCSHTVTAPPSQAAPAPAPAPLGRGHRIRRITQKLRDMLPEGPRRPEPSADGLIVREELHAPADAETSPLPRSPPLADLDELPDRPQARRVILRVREIYRTAKNGFGVFREYRSRPSTIPDLVMDNSAVFEPTAEKAVPKEVPKSIKDIISPFPNISSWRLRRFFSLTPNANSKESQRKFISDIVRAPDYVSNDCDVPLDAIEKKLAQACFEWEDKAHGWREGCVTLEIPTGEKQREQHTTRNRRATVEDADDDDEPLSSYSYDVKGFHYRPLTQVLQTVFSTHDDLHYEPFKTFTESSSAGEEPERIYSELYDSDAMNNAHEELVRQPPEEGCTAPRVVGAICLYSDSTVPTQFGQGKVWPVYMYVGNQSKYTQGKPSARAAHHVAYLPSVRSIR